MSAPLVLASESRYRRELMNRLHIPYLAVAHRCDEAALERGIEPPHAVAELLARAKADSLATAYPDAFILGSDQVVEIDGQILGKPGTAEAAVGQLELLQGREHRLITAVALRTPDGHFEQAVDVHRMRMRATSAAERERYVAADSPLDACGSYLIEGLGIALFEAIEGADFTAIIGLPMIAVISMLRGVGFCVP